MRARLAVAVLVLLAFALPALADSGTGCPLNILAGAKMTEDENGNQIPHPGQWFTANYDGNECGTDESGVTWAVTTEPPISDTCFGAWDYLVTQGLGQKRCRRDSGKVFWLPPGTWTLTACAPPIVEGVCAGTRTIDSVVVD